MAVDRPFGLMSAQDAIGVIRDTEENVEVSNIIPTRMFYRWIAQVDRLIGTSSVLSDIENGSVTLAEQVVLNTEAIVALTEALNVHAALTAAHASNGNIVGDDDKATLLGEPGVLIKRSARQPDSVAPDLATLVAEFNTLLASVTAAGVLE